MATRFVILCQPRTGSSCLEASLRRHPGILMHGEILNHRYEYLLPDEGYGRLVAALADSRPNVRTVGCDLKAFQPDRNWSGWRRWESAWDALADAPSIKVIHLDRRDTLAQLASWKVADALGNWGDQSGVSNRPTVRIDPEELRWFRQWNQALYAWRLSRLARHEILSIQYESLCSDWDGSIRGILEFLSVNPIALAPATRKNEGRPLADVIENWRELQGV